MKRLARSQRKWEDDNDLDWEPNVVSDENNVGEHDHSDKENEVLIKV